MPAKNLRSDSVDKEIGSRLKLFRTFNGFSQSYVAEKIGVTFQQLQKYETGKNRVSAATLIELSKIMKIEIGDLIGQDKKSDITTAGNYKALMKDKDFMALMDGWQKIDDPALKKQIIKLLKNMTPKNTLLK